MRFELGAISEALEIEEVISGESGRLEVQVARVIAESSRREWETYAPLHFSKTLLQLRTENKGIVFQFIVYPKDAASEFLASENILNQAISVPSSARLSILYSLAY